MPAARQALRDATAQIHEALHGAAPFARLSGPAPAPTIDLTIHFRTRLPHPGMAPEDPVLARFTSSTSQGGFFEEDGQIWAPDGTLLVQCRQLALLFPGG